MIWCFALLSPASWSWPPPSGESPVCLLPSTGKLFKDLQHCPLPPRPHLLRPCFMQSGLHSHLPQSDALAKHTALLIHPRSTSQSLSTLASLQDLSGDCLLPRASLFLCVVALNSSGLLPASLECPHLTSELFPFTLCLRAGAAQVRPTLSTVTTGSLWAVSLGSHYNRSLQLCFWSFERASDQLLHPLWMSCRCLGLNMPQTHHPTPPNRTHHETTCQLESSRWPLAIPCPHPSCVIAFQVLLMAHVQYLQICFIPEAASLIQTTTFSCLLYQSNPLFPILLGISILQPKPLSKTNIITCNSLVQSISVFF